MAKRATFLCFVEECNCKVHHSQHHGLLYRLVKGRKTSDSVLLLITLFDFTDFIFMCAVADESQDRYKIHLCSVLAHVRNITNKDRFNKMEFICHRRSKPGEMGQKRRQKLLILVTNSRQTRSTNKLSSLQVSVLKRQKIGDFPTFRLCSVVTIHFAVN